MLQVFGQPQSTSLDGLSEGRLVFPRTLHGHPSRDDGGNRRCVSELPLEGAVQRVALFASELRSMIARTPLPRTYSRDFENVNVRKRRRVVAMCLPRWLPDYFPVPEIAAVVTPAVIQGSRSHGSVVVLPQTTLDDRCAVRHMQLYLTDYEFADLRAFGREAGIASTDIAARTALFVGLRVPYGHEGVVSSPRECDRDTDDVGLLADGWSLSRSAWETLCVLSGAMSREQFEGFGYSALSSLLYLMENDALSFEHEVRTLLTTTSPRYMTRVREMLHRHRLNIGIGASTHSRWLDQRQRTRDARRDAMHQPTRNERRPQARPLGMAG